MNKFSKKYSRSPFFLYSFIFLPNLSSDFYCSKKNKRIFVGEKNNSMHHRAFLHGFLFLLKNRPDFFQHAAWKIRIIGGGEGKAEAEERKDLGG